MIASKNPEDNIQHCNYLFTYRWCHLCLFPVYPLGQISNIRMNAQVKQHITPINTRVPGFIKQNLL